MNETTVRALNAINAEFYREAAGEFSATRERAWRGWQRVLPWLEAQPTPAPLSVLDLGCGNARLASFLCEALASRRLHYLGVDASEGLLDLARKRAPADCEPTFRRVDLVVQEVDATLPAGPFDLVALFGVLHHVPSRIRRRALLEAAARRLAPAGVLAVTAWRFTAHERFRKRSVAWKEYNRSAATPVDLAELEPDDFLIRWGDGDDTLRYCHAIDEAELQTLTADLPLEPCATFLDDGELNRYAIFRGTGR